MSFTPSRPFLPVDLNDSRVIDAECIPLQAIAPTVKVMLRRTYKSAWAEGQHVLGRDMIARFILSLYAGCLSPTAKAVDRVYRLLDHAISGRTYTIGSPTNEHPEGAPIPAIPSVPGDFDGAYAHSLVAQLLAVQGTIRNGDTGEPYGTLPATDGKLPLLRQILQAIEQQQAGGELDDEMLAELVKIGLALL